MTIRTMMTASLAALATAQASPALAQAPLSQSAAAPAANSRTTSYDAAYFHRYAPRTALDIIRRLPGFTLDLGGAQNEIDEADVRGFAGTAGNVVINGSRPSSKSESLESVLAKIPASRVARVDVGPGDLFGADYSSKSQVANIILAAGGGIAGTSSVSLQRNFNGYVTPNAEASLQFTRGKSTVTASANSNRTDAFEEGYDLITDLATGEELELREKVNRIFPHNPYVTAGWALDGGTNRSAHVNARYAPESFYLEQFNHVTPVGGAERDDTLHQVRKTRTAEIGGDVARPLFGGGLKLLGLANRTHRRTFEDYLVRGLGGSPLIEGSEQRTESQRNESLGRLSWTRPQLAGFSVDTGVEVAWNTLDYALEIFDIAADGSKAKADDLPIANARVTELRGELFLNVGRSLTPKLRVDGGINYEFSRLNVSGDASARRSLRFFKPNITVDWQPGGGWHTQASLRRTVAQLDFYDFVSGAELSNNQVNGGNENLLPQRTWEARWLVEHPFLGKGKARLELGHDQVSMLQDRILVFTSQGAFDAPGNLGTGTRSFATLTLDAPLDMLWPGLRARANATWQRTRVDDPITGRPRSWSNFYPKFEWDIDVRRDAGNFSYGFTMAGRTPFYIYRTDVVAEFGNIGPASTAFVEYRPKSDLAITLDANNWLNSAGYIDRQLYHPNRLAPLDAVNDYRRRDSHVQFRLTLKKSFGGGGVAN